MYRMNPIIRPNDRDYPAPAPNSRRAEATSQTMGGPATCNDHVMGDDSICVASTVGKTPEVQL